MRRNQHRDIYKSLDLIKQCKEINMCKKQFFVIGLLLSASSGVHAGGEDLIKNSLVLGATALTAQQLSSSILGTSVVKYYTDEYGVQPVKSLVRQVPYINQVPYSDYLTRTSVRGADAE